MSVYFKMYTFNTTSEGIYTDGWCGLPWSWRSQVFLSPANNQAGDRGGMYSFDKELFAHVL